jgi:hypothetical protein
MEWNLAEILFCIVGGRISKLHISITELYARRRQHAIRIEDHHHQNGCMRFLPLALPLFPNAFDMPLSGSAWSKVQPRKAVRIVSSRDDAGSSDVYCALVLWIISGTQVAI